MVCCFSHSVLTKAERDAIAKLREKRAQGTMPRSAATHTTATDRLDPVVSFYTNPYNHQHQRRAKPPLRPTPQLLPSHHHPKSSASPSSGNLLLGKSMGSSSHGGVKWKRNVDYVYGSSASSGSGSSASSDHFGVRGKDEVSSSSSPQLLRKGVEKLTGSSQSNRKLQPYRKGVGRTDTKTKNMDIDRIDDHEKRKEIEDGDGDGKKEQKQQLTSNTGMFLMNVAQNAVNNVNVGGGRRRNTECNTRNSKHHRLNHEGNAVSNSVDKFKDKAASSLVNIWQKIKTSPSNKADKEKDDEEKEEEDVDVNVKPNAIGRIAFAGKKKLDDVLNLFVHGSSSNDAKGERFVIKERPHLSDLAEEAYNDVYFQELMRGD